MFRTTIGVSGVQRFKKFNWISSHGRTLRAQRGKGGLGGLYTPLCIVA